MEQHGLLQPRHPLDRNRLGTQELVLLERRKRASLLQQLFRLARLLDQAALDRLASSGGPRLTRSHPALLPHLDLEGTRLVDLAARVGVSKQAVGQLVDDLQAMGVVERAADPLDRRARRVRFTGRGFRALLHGLGVLQQMEEELEAAIGSRKLEALREGVDAALSSTEGDRPASRPRKPPRGRR